MKHGLRTTTIIILLFVIAQLFALWSFSLNLSQKTSIVLYGNMSENITTYSNMKTIVGDRPMMSPVDALFYVLFGIGFATLLLLIIIKSKKKNIWNGWYFISITLAMSITLGVWINHITDNLASSSILAGLIAVALSYLKFRKNNAILHNITEIIIYTGLAILFAPLLNIITTFILLVMISIYDMISVWKTKHMIIMAKFLTSTSNFTGFAVPNNGISLKHSANVKKKSKDKKDFSDRSNIAILGNGDVSFPMWFVLVFFKSILNNSNNFWLSFNYSLIIIFSSAAALTLLFVFSKKGKFYPAMPFITSGIAVGYMLTILAGIIL